LYNNEPLSELISPEENTSPFRLQSHRKLRRVLLAVYFMGILHCENNKIKAFGAVKGDEPLSPFLNLANVKGKGHLVSKNTNFIYNV